MIDDGWKSRREVRRNTRSARFCLLAAIFATFAPINSAPASAQEIFDAVRSGDLNRVEELISKGDEMDVTGPVGTPLHLSALRGDAAVAHALIQGGATLDRVVPTVGSPLHAAANRGHTDVVSLLLEAGANPNIRDDNALTPLHFAAFEGYRPIVRLLIEQGADPNAIGRGTSGVSMSGFGFGETSALHLAKWSGHKEIAEDLIAAGARAEPIEDISDNLTGGDAERGRQLATNFCIGCHQLTSDGPVPPLAGVFGREVGKIDEYPYSDALAEMGGVWDEGRLFSFLRHPMLVAPGTKMIAKTTEDEAILADIVVYLKESADTPQ